MASSVSLLRRENEVTDLGNLTEMFVRCRISHDVEKLEGVTEVRAPATFSNDPEGNAPDCEVVFVFDAATGVLNNVLVVGNGVRVRHLESRRKGPR